MTRAKVTLSQRNKVPIESEQLANRNGINWREFQLLPAIHLRVTLFPYLAQKARK